MVNGLHLYSAFIQSPVQFTQSHSPIHTHIHTPTAIGCHARYQPARQEQSGVRRLAQGHFDTPRVGSNRQPSDCQTTALTSWAASPLRCFFVECFVLLQLLGVVTKSGLKCQQAGKVSEHSFSGGWNNKVQTQAGWKPAQKRILISDWSRKSAS